MQVRSISSDIGVADLREDMSELEPQATMAAMRAFWYASAIQPGTVHQVLYSQNFHMRRFGFSQRRRFSAMDGGKCLCFLARRHLNLSASSPLKKELCFLVHSRHGCGQLKMLPMSLGKSRRLSTNFVPMSANDCCHDANRDTLVLTRREALG